MRKWLHLRDNLGDEDGQEEHVLGAWRLHDDHWGLHILRPHLLSPLQQRLRRRRHLRFSLTTNRSELSGRSPPLLLLLLLPHRCLDVQSRKEVVPLFLTGHGKNTSTKQKGSSCTFKSDTILSLVLSRCKLECQLVSNFMLRPRKRRGANNFSEVRHTFPM